MTTTLEVKKIPERKDVPQQYTWDTAAIFPSDEAWQQAYDKLKGEIPAIASYAGKLGQSAQTLCDYLDLSFSIEDSMEGVYLYSSMKQDEDTRVADYQAMAGKSMMLAVSLRSADAFSAPEIMAIPDETLEQFYKDCPALELYRRHLTVLRSQKEHTLSDAEEKLLAAAGDISGIARNTYSKLANADMTFPDAIDSEGVAHPLSNGSFVGCEESADRALRKDAFEKLYGGYAKVKNAVATTLGGNMKTLKFFADARKFPNTLQAALSNTRVPETVYHTLVDTVNKNLDKMHKYVSLRKKLLGVDELHMYDVYTPMIADVDMNISYEQAKDTVYDALEILGDDYRRAVKEAFDNRWIDVYENVGKRSGAYSTGGAKPHPYMLLNHKDNLDSMFTLAHEMGHSIHSYYSCHNQPLPYQNYVIFVAEVASTCNEALLMEYLLARTTDKKQRAYLINHFLEQFKGTLYRQTMFAEFELRLNELTAAGETLTADLLCSEYKALNEKYFGPDMVSDEGISYEWARIPHFYFNYYVYQYATGYSAAIALSRRIIKEGAPAVKDYLGFLSGGCSKDPIDLLKDAGVDMSTADPIQSALDLFGELIDEMEELMK